MKRKVLAILMAAAMVFSLAACSSSGSAASGTSSGGTGSSAAANDGQEKVLIVSLGGDPTSLNPDAVTDDNLSNVASSLFSGLLTLNSNE